jgi:transposase InsO family protein
VTQDDLLYRFRLRVFAMAAELGNVRAACRAMGIHPSTYYRWKRQLDRHGPEILRPRERRVPRMANATSPLIEQRVVAFALGHPGFGRPASPPSSPGPSGARSACHPTGCGGCCAATACPPAPDATAWSPGTRPHRPLSGPSHDPSSTWTWSTLGSWSSWTACCIGRLSGTKGTVWQYTAIDVASAYTWATLQVTRRNPSAQWTSQLARQVAADLAERGWKLERVMSDNASEFRSATFQATTANLGARHGFIRAGRPQTNGCVERVQQTILDECWKPAFARYLIPKQAGRGSTWNATCATTTPSGPTPAAGPGAEHLKRSWERPSCGRRSADASPQLGDRTS